MKKTKKSSKKKNKNKKIMLFGLIITIVITILIVFIILNRENKNVLDSKQEEKTEEKAEEKEVQIIDINSTTRPFAIMINNEVTARPYHSGLQEAYIVYEIIVEGGITRYLALYKDVDVERIHGVRSARHYYLDYAIENDAYFIHWGGSPQAFSDIKKLDIDTMEVYHNKGAFYDYSLPVANEHSTYTSTSKLNEYIQKKNYDEETSVDNLLTYSAEELDLSKIEDMETANEIDIKYSNSYISNFIYNEENGYYLMSVNDKEHKDYVTGDQYHFENIITYKVDNYSIDSYGRQGIDNIGSGTGYYISKGKAVPIMWEKTSRESQTKYTYMDGTELVVNDGNTYIAIQPTKQTLKIS